MLLPSKIQSRLAIRWMALIAILLLPISTKSEDYLESRPCGPDSVRGPIRLLFIQGHKGANFRCACRRHDACYDTLGGSQESCDQVFLKDLLLAAENSSQPKRARRKAKLLYFLVSRFGGGAYRSAQELAMTRQK